MSVSTQSVDIGSALAQVRRWPSAEARRWTAGFLGTFCDDPSILAIIVYGSSVRNVVRSSDIDLLFVYETLIPHVPIPPFDIDVRGYERSTVEEHLRTGHDLLGWAVRYGVILCERSGYWSDLVERWRDNLPLPEASVSEERAEKAHRLRHDLLRMGDYPAAKEQYLSYLTHTARANLLRRGIYPRSRPELPAQLIGVGEEQLATDLLAAMSPYE